MNRKKARFDVVSIEISVHCPTCDQLAEAPVFGSRFTWNVAAIQHNGHKDLQCKGCHTRFRLPYVQLSRLLAPSSEPVRTERRVSHAQIEIICANCAGDETQPRTTLMTTNQCCAGCGGTNFVLANGSSPTVREGVTQSAVEPAHSK